MCSFITKSGFDITWISVINTIFRGSFAGGPVFIPLGLEYVRFLIKVAQTAHLSKAVQEAASVSYMNPR